MVRFTLFVAPYRVIAVEGQATGLGTVEYSPKTA